MIVLTVLYFMTRLLLSFTERATDIIISSPAYFGLTLRVNTISIGTCSRSVTSRPANISFSSSYTSTTYGTTPRVKSSPSPLGIATPPKNS